MSAGLVGLLAVLLDVFEGTIVDQPSSSVGVRPVIAPYQSLALEISFVASCSLAFRSVH